MNCARVWREELERSEVMGKGLLAGIVACVLASCGGHPPTSIRAEKKRASPAPGRPKAAAGQVSFSSLTGRQLAAIRVIPEQGGRLFQPENVRYRQVDGFWWKGEPDRWFKIPDFSEVWVGRRPSRFDGEAHRGELRIYYSRPAVLGVMDRWSTRVLQPAWVADAGESRSPVARPEGVLTPE